jgi:hypothetical protein
MANNPGTAQQLAILKFNFPSGCLSGHSGAPQAFRTLPGRQKTAGKTP